MNRRVDFYTSGGFKLAAILHLAEGTAERRPAVVLCQGPGGTKEYLVPEVAAWLNRSGMVCLCFDYRGWGESEGLKNRLIPLEQVDDIRCALTFLEQQPEVNPGRLGLWGAATGGALVSYTAAIDSRVRCMVCVNGMGDLGRWFRATRPYWAWRQFEKRLAEDRTRRALTGRSELLETSEIIVRDPESTAHARLMEERFPEMKGRKLELTLESAEAMTEFHPVEVVARIAPRAACWIVAGEDRLVPLDESGSMFRAAGEPRRLAVIPDEEHHALYSGKGFQAMMNVSTEWFGKHL